MRIQEFDYSVDILQAILWKYDEAVTLQSLLSQKQDWYTVNQTEFWSNWYNDVFNLLTANDFGLSVWAQILGLPIFINTNPDPVGKPIWGFGTNYKNFTHGNFSNSNQNISLPTEQKRIILRLRYFQLITRGAAPEVNAFLQIVFADYGSVYMLDGLDMSITYVFTFTPPPNLLTVLKDYDILPRPAGVGIKYVINPGQYFGFGSAYKNFDNGILSND